MNSFVNANGRLLIGLTLAGVLVGAGLGFTLGRSNNKSSITFQRPSINRTLQEAQRELAADRSAQSMLRNALVAEKTIYVDTGKYTTSVEELKKVEPALEWRTGEGPDATGAEREIVYVAVLDGSLYLSIMSEAGNCFYLMDGSNGDTAFARSDRCGPASVQTYSPDGWKA